MISSHNVSTPKVMQIMMLLTAMILCGSSVVLSFDASANKNNQDIDVQMVPHAATTTLSLSSNGARSDDVGFSILRTVAKAMRPTPLPQELSKEPRSLDDYFTVIVRGDADATAEKELIADVAYSLPEAHFESLDKVFLLYDDPEARRGLGGATKMLLRAINVTQDEFISLFVHELAHSVDLGILDGETGMETKFYDGVIPIVADDPSLDFYRISWKAADEPKDNVRPEDFVSGYAATDCFEDFAESYLYYVLHGREFRKLKKGNIALAKKYEFIKMLFVGREFDTGDETNIGEEIPWDATKLRLGGSLVGEVQ